MKKSRLFMAAGTFALAITAIFATKANKRFTAINTAHTGSYYVHVGSVDFLTANVAGAGNQLQMKICTHSGTVPSISGGGLLVTIHNSGPTDKVYFNP